VDELNPGPYFQFVGSYQDRKALPATAARVDWTRHIVYL
jgi:hypothetical protein